MKRQTLFEQKPEHWNKKRCPICKEEFIYNIVYEPNTCNKFDCLHKYLHPELSKDKIGYFTKVVDKYL